MQKRPNLKRKGFDSETEIIINSIANPKSAMDLYQALLHPLSEFSKKQRRDEERVFTEHLYILEIIRAVNNQEFKLNEKERELIRQQQIIDHVQKQLALNEQHEEFLKTVRRQAETNAQQPSYKPPILTEKEWQTQIAIKKQEIDILKQSIINLENILAKNKTNSESLQSAWENVKKAKVEQYTQDLVANDIQFIKHDGTKIDPASADGQDIINKINDISPMALVDEYLKLHSQINTLHEQRKAEIEKSADSTKAIPPPPPPPIPSVEEFVQKGKLLKQLLLLTELSGGATGDELEKIFENNKVAIAQIAKSDETAENQIAAKIQKALNITVDEQNIRESSGDNPFSNAVTAGHFFGLALKLTQERMVAQESLTTNKRTLDKALTALIADEKNYAAAYPNAEKPKAEPPKSP